MKWKYQLFLAMVITSGLVACRETPLESMNALFREQYLKIDPGGNLDNTTAIIILPGVGCSGCITSVEDFLKTNYENDKGIKFILTDIVSKKLLKTKLKLNLEHENIMLDEQNLFSVGIFDTLYPTILILDKEGKIKEFKYVSPDEDGLAYFQ